MLTEEILVKRAEKSLYELSALVTDETAPTELRKSASEVLVALTEDLSDPRLKSVSPQTREFAKSIRTAMSLTK